MEQMASDNVDVIAHPSPAPPALPIVVPPPPPALTVHSDTLPESSPSPVDSPPSAPPAWPELARQKDDEESALDNCPICHARKCDTITICEHAFCSVRVFFFFFFPFESHFTSELY